MRLAVTGIRYLFLYHRNMRIIFLFGIAAFLLGIYKGLHSLELVALCITITIVFIAEVFNTATEMMLDLLWSKYHIRIKVIKDIAAAVTLLASLNAVAVGYILLVKKFLK